MKAAVFCSATLFSLATFAFPANLLNNDISEDTLAEITALASKIAREAEARRQVDMVKPRFNADAQRISTSGENRYIAPGPHDIRGPCPGLNVMANHGYLSRDGVSSVVELTTASTKVFGMGLELSAFLSVYSSVMAGNLTACSIGGKPNNDGILGGLGSTLGLVGEPQGLSASHNRFEADASPTRADLYKTGDPVSLDMSQFEQLMAMPQGPNGIDLTVLVPFRLSRIHNSIATNGHYFAGPFTHIAINAATFFFTYRYFANHTVDHPEGYLDTETLKSFESVTGEKGSYKWTPGHERIPENWHRRAIGDEYGIPGLTVDATAAVLAHPELLNIGGNTGKPNTFTGIHVGDLTGGVFSEETLLEGNNLMCFAFQAASIATPDILKGLVGNVLAAVQKLTEALDPILQTLACPQLEKYNASLLQNYPGAGSGI